MLGSYLFLELVSADLVTKQVLRILARHREGEHHTLLYLKAPTDKFARNFDDSEPDQTCFHRMRFGMLFPEQLRLMKLLLWCMQKKKRNGMGG